MKSEIKILLESSKNIALFGHKNPDGDCVGALLGFGSLLEKMDKKIKYFTPTLPSRIYNFLPNIKKISTKFDYANYDLLVFLDFSDITRISSFYEKNPKYFQNKKILVIDHHIYKEKNENRYIISDDTAMSACEVVFENTYKQWSKFYDSNIATYLYVGLTTDSGNFRYDEDHKRILKNALDLIELGADKKMVVNNAFRKKSFAGVKMMEIMFKRLNKKRELVYSWYTEKDLEKFNIDREEADYGQIIIQDIDEAKVSIIFREDKKNKKCCMSFRSKDYDVQKLAKKFGGGGHIHAAGAIVTREGSFCKQVDLISSQISKFI